MTVLYLDFETKDGFIGAKLGAGWAYALHTKAKEFKVLGMAYTIVGITGEITHKDYTADPTEMYLAVELADTLVMHNAQYDLGCLKVLGISVEGKKIFDTMVMAKLYDNSLMSYSLENLSKMYLGVQKDTELLANTVLEMQEYQNAEIRDKSNPKTALKWAYSNMDLLPVPVVAEYAMKDIECTKGLYEFFKDKIDRPELAEKYSYVQKICVDMRARGVRIDLEKAHAASRALNLRIVDLCEKIFNVAGHEINLNSSRELAALLESQGIECPRTDKDNVSVTTEFLESQSSELCQWIADAKMLTKVKNDFIVKILAIAELTVSPCGRYGRVFPELNLMEAVTGRFSSSNPNIQQIPARDPEMGKLCRGIFIAEEGEKIFAADFSNQEGRLQVHYAYGQQCEGSALMKVEFDRNPNFDVHQKVADLVGVDRKTAKTINLGLSYGMGGGKLCRSLGLPTEIWETPEGTKVEVAGKRGKAIINKYKEMCPYLVELSEKCQEAMKKNRYIRTLGGRMSRMEPPLTDPVTKKRKSTEYKALNKLVQGSAADQTIEAMLQAEKAGIKMLFPVHDEIVISGTREDAIKLKDIMENAVKLHVPVVAEVDLNGGDSWADA